MSGGNHSSRQVRSDERRARTKGSSSPACKSAAAAVEEAKKTGKQRNAECRKYYAEQSLGSLDVQPTCEFYCHLAGILLLLVLRTP